MEIFVRMMRLKWSHFSKKKTVILGCRDRREYRYRIESTDSKSASISISLSPGISGVSVSVSVLIQRPEHFLEGPGRIYIK